MRLHRINKVRIHGFRRLRDLELPMRPLMAMIGANGVGKSSLLDAFSLLAASAAGKLNPRLSEMGGITETMTYDRATDMSFSVGMEVPEHQPLQYDFRLVPRGQSYTISSEVLSQVRDGYGEPFKHIESYYSDIKYYEIEERKLVRPSWEHNPLETSLSQVPKMFHQPEELRRVLSSATQYHFLDVGPRAPVKLPQQMKPVDFPGIDGEDLIPFLFYLRESNPERYAMIEDSLRAAFPDFINLNFPPVAAGMLALTWRDRNYSKPLFMNQLSEGMLRFIWLAALLQSPALSTVTMIDEPEVSLHPELLSLLADLMREAAQRTQLIVATHSDRLIRFLQPEEVLVMDMDEDGSAIARWADTLNLDDWLAEYSLDQIWQMGRMGGRA